MPKSRDRRSIPQKPSVGSWQLVPTSVRIVVHNYEQVAFLFLLPSLILVLGLFYLGSFPKDFQDILHPNLSRHQETGLLLVLLWLVISIINYPPAIYFRLQAARHPNAPSLAKCYREGLRHFGRVWLSAITSTIIIAVGFLALIVPGVLLFRRYILAPYYAMDNPKFSLRQTLHRSSSDSSHFIFAVYSTYGVIILFNLIAEYFLGGYAISSVLIDLVSYAVLLLPALRYIEIVNSIKPHKG